MTPAQLFAANESRRARAFARRFLHNANPNARALAKAALEWAQTCDNFQQFEGSQCSS